MLDERGFNSNVREEEVNPENRYLFIDMFCPFNFPDSLDELKRDRYPHKNDDDFELIKQEFLSFLREIENPNLYSVGMFKSYANIPLPKTYDIIFDINNPNLFYKQKTIVKYAYNYRDIFHTDLWNGHSSHLIIEIIGKPPLLFEGLSKNGEKSRKQIGLCSEYDWQFIKKIDN